MLFSLHEFVVVALDELEVVCWPESDSPPAASVDEQSFAAALGVAVEEETNFPSSTAVDWGCCNWVSVQVVQQALFSTSSGFFGLFSHYFYHIHEITRTVNVLKLQSQFSMTLRAFLTGIKSHFQAPHGQAPHLGLNVCTKASQNFRGYLPHSGLNQNVQEHFW